MTSVGGHSVRLLFKSLHQDLEVVVGEGLDGVERRDFDGANDAVGSVVGRWNIRTDDV